MKLVELPRHHKQNPCSSEILFRCSSPAAPSCQKQLQQTYLYRVAAASNKLFSSWEQEWECKENCLSFKIGSTRPLSLHWWQLPRNCANKIRLRCICFTNWTLNNILRLKSLSAISRCSPSPPHHPHRLLNYFFIAILRLCIFLFA